MLDLAALALACAPMVHVTTLEAVVNHESGAYPFAIGVNGPKQRSIYPSSYDDAVDVAKTLMRQGVDFDAGLGSINVRNWAWLGLTADTVFHPCTNLRATQTVLVDCHRRASKKYSPGRPTLLATLSCYNTGTFTRGFTNGYVRTLLSKAGVADAVKIPAIDAGDTTTVSPPTQATPTPRAEAKADDADPSDAFARSAPDALSGIDRTKPASARGHYPTP